MLSKATTKLIRSLDTRKGRRQEGLFVAEGPKLVGELLNGFTCVRLLATLFWQQAHPHLFDTFHGELVSEDELHCASLQPSPQQVLALFCIPQDEVDIADVVQHQLCIALDGVQDPGNLGTIVRLADWFGIEHIFCSSGTADVWNPKAVQATMGSLARVSIHYVDLAELLSGLPATVPVYSTSLQGDSLWEHPLSATGVIVMGNEGNGVSAEVDALCHSRLLIPNYPAGRPAAESLNVAMATGIVLAEFRRRAEVIH